MAVRNSPASTRRDTKTLQMRICDIPRCGELKVRGQQRDTRAWCLSKRMRTPRLVVQSSRTTRRGSVSITSAGTIPVAGQPEQSMAASGAGDARIDHVRRRRGPVTRRWRRRARVAPSARNILPPGPTRLVNAGIALLGARARGAGPVDRMASAPRMQRKDAIDNTRDSQAPATATSLAPGSATLSQNRDRRCSGHARPRARARTHIFACRTIPDTRRRR